VVVVGWRGLEMQRVVVRGAGLERTYVVVLGIEGELAQAMALWTRL
jgi:hypothetical protein